MIDTRHAGHGCNGSLTIYSERNKGSELPHTRSYMLLELQAADQPGHYSKTLWEGKGQIQDCFLATACQVCFLATACQAHQ